ncbi:hypothetical protein WJX72_000743 [[Myrmecia] bisecta]|uniref:Androgen receptor n=1 Tax=[Myrmecia] bisecta TaxID=41462 RepID=A0AAW1Q0P6_9CHLO
MDSQQQQQQQQQQRERVSCQGVSPMPPLELPQAAGRAQQPLGSPARSSQGTVAQKPCGPASTARIRSAGVQDATARQQALCDDHSGSQAAAAAYPSSYHMGRMGVLEQNDSQGPAEPIEPGERHIGGASPAIRTAGLAEQPEAVRQSASGASAEGTGGPLPEVQPHPIRQVLPNAGGDPRHSPSDSLQQTAQQQHQQAPYPAV